MKVSQDVEGATSFGKELKVSPKSLALMNKEGLAVDFAEPTISVRVTVDGIDGILILGKDAWEKHKSGTKVEIKTYKDFKTQ